MQAITIAIGKNGIQFFIGHYLVPVINQLLATLKPVDRSIGIPDFTSQDGDVTYTLSNISIELQQGMFLGFNPVFQAWVQGLDDHATPIFTLSFQASEFTAQYTWTEDYALTTMEMTPGPPPSFSTTYTHPHNTFPYTPGFGGLALNVVIQFIFNSARNNWEMITGQVTAQAQLPQANIPSRSGVQLENIKCFSAHVDDATASTIGSIDFNGGINALLKGVIASIPGSGDLGNGIVFDFSLGDSGLAFPNNDGVQMGVKGGTSYNGSAFPGTPPPPLPFPATPADADSHHLNMYVSNYEVDALNWGYFKAGKLDLLIQPDQLPNPEALKVATYTAFEPTLQAYAAFVMNAQITQNSAPSTSFQTVYLFDKAVMDLLQQQLPNNIDQLIQGLQGNAYVSQAALEAFLNSATVPTSYFTAIENASKISAMALTQDMAFTLLIQNGQSELPNIKFAVQRVDILINLSLGINTNGNQTMQFGFANASNVASFISSSIPGFDGSTFAKIVWPVTAESLYAQNLDALGANGVPLPIMEGLQFDFDNAQLSIQEGFVSILANVNYKNPSPSFVEFY